MASTRNGTARADSTALVVYGDFNCPYSYLASQRVDEIRGRGVEQVEWRAVEHDRRISLTGEPTVPERARWQDELDEVAALAREGEQRASSVPPMQSNTKAATSAYAEALTDGIEHTMRALLFDAIWVQQRNVSTAYEVRQLVTQLMWPPAPLRVYRGTDLPMPSSRVEPARVARLLGGTVAPDGGPLTTPAYRRIRRWRDDWLALEHQVVPTVVDVDGKVHPGVAGLHRLAEILDASAAGALAGRPQARAGGTGEVSGGGSGPPSASSTAGAQTDSRSRAASGSRRG